MSFMSRSVPLIIKTFLYQLVMSFFGIMMFTATSRNTALMVIGQILVIGFYLYIFFSQSMQAGSKECEYGIGHETKTTPWMGLIPILLGFVPMILLSVWGAIQPPFAPDGSQSASYVPYLLNNLLQQGVYSGNYAHLFPAGDTAEQAAQAINARALLFTAAFLPGWIAGSLGYIYGWRRFTGSKADRKTAQDGQETGEA